MACRRTNKNPSARKPVGRIVLGNRQAEMKHIINRRASLGASIEILSRGILRAREAMI